MSNAVAIPEASPRDREVQAVVLRLVEAYAFGEAAAVLQARLREISETRQSRIERIFLDWCDLPEADRPDFLTYAHHRRHPEISGAAGDVADTPRPDQGHLKGEEDART